MVAFREIDLLNPESIFAVYDDYLLVMKPTAWPRIIRHQKYAIPCLYKFAFGLRQYNYFTPVLQALETSFYIQPA
jgi:hypothetical protein